VFITNQPILGIGPSADAIPWGARNVVPVLEQLLFQDEDGNIVGGPLAPSYDVSPDGLNITLHLREGINFTDGTPFTAEAVKVNLQQCYEKKVIGSADLASVESYDIIDDYTIRLVLSKYNYHLLQSLAGVFIGQIASPTALALPSTPETLAELHTVGTGPFIFDSYERDSYVRYKRNPNYWQEGRPYLDELEIRTNPDLTVTLMAFRSGDAQWIENIDPIDALALQDEGNFTDTAEGLSFIHGLVPDNDPNSPLADKRVREAIEYALNKQEMMDGVGKGYYRVPSQLAMPEYGGYDPSLAPREYDPEKAKQLLADAGYPDGLTITLITDVSGRKDILTAVTQYLAESGINIELDMADAARINAVRTETGWEGIFMSGGPAISNDLGSWRSFGAPYNAVDMIRRADWNDRWDDLVSTVDTEARNDKWREMVRIIYEDVSIIPYECDSPLYATNSDLHDLGWCKNGVGQWYDCANVWLSK